VGFSFEKVYLFCALAVYLGLCLGVMPLLLELGLFEIQFCLDKKEKRKKT